MLRIVFLLCSSLLLSACEQLGIDTPAQTAARQEAEGRAVGGACRHAGRALEDCYASSPRISKAAIYNGWRDMDAYMRENKLEVVVPEADREEEEAPKPSKKAEKEGAEEENAKAKPAEAKPVEAEPSAPKTGGKSKQS